MLNRFHVIAPNGKKVSAVWADEDKTILQTWSGNRKRWESFPISHAELSEECVLDMVTEKRRIINKAGNKIEFSDGTVYAKQSHTGLFRKVKTFVL